MDNFSDETLMAYADEALPPAEMRRMAALIARDTGLSARLQPYVVTRTALPRIFSDAQLGPIPRRLLDTVMSAPIGTQQQSSRTSSVFENLRNFLLPETSFGRTLALCGTVIAIAGAGWIVSNVGLRNGGSHELIANVDDKPLARGALATALETALMRQQVAAADGSIIMPVVTFRNADGQFCRQFEISGTGTTALGGYACRNSSGQWQVGFQGMGPRMATAADPTSNVPADGAPNAELSAAIDNIIMGDALDLSGESVLIGNGWKRQVQD